MCGQVHEFSYRGKIKREYDYCTCVHVLIRMLDGREIMCTMRHQLEDVIGRPVIEYPVYRNPFRWYGDGDQFIPEKRMNRYSDFGLCDLQETLHGSNFSIDQYPSIYGRHFGRRKVINIHETEFDHPAEIIPTFIIFSASLLGVFNWISYLM